MKKLCSFFFLLFLHSTQCMNLALIQQPDSEQKTFMHNYQHVFKIKEIGLIQYLNMISRVNFAKTCKEWYTTINPTTMWYQNVHPGWLDTQGCKELNYTSYTHAMIYYARQNNMDMLDFTHENTNDENKKLSISICNALNKSFRKECDKKIRRSYRDTNEANNITSDTEKMIFNFIYNNVNAAHKEDAINMCLELKKNLAQIYAHNSYSSYFKRLTKYGLFTCGWDWRGLYSLKEKIIPHIIHLFLLQGMDVNWKFEVGGTFLHFIAEGKTTYFLVDQIMSHPQIDVNIKNQYADDPLLCTIFEPNEHKKDQIKPRLAITQKLLERSDTNLNSQDKNGKTPLLLALKHNRKDLVELLLKNRKTDLNIADNEKNAPLHYPIIYKFIDLINKRDISLTPNIQDKHGNGPLHYARTGEAINFLFSLPDIDVNIKNDLGETPLHCSIKNPDKIINYPDNPYHQIAMKPTYTCNNMKYLLTNPQINVNDKNNEGETPLHYAIKCFTSFCVSPHLLCIETITLLLDHGAEINPTDNQGETPLDYAFKLNHHEKEKIVSLLQEKGAIQGSFSEKFKKMFELHQYSNSSKKENIFLQAHIEDSQKNALQSFVEKHRKAILTGSLLGILGLISITIFAYFHYNTNSSTQ